MNRVMKRLIGAERDGEMPSVDLDAQLNNVNSTYKILSDDLGAIVEALSEYGSWVTQAGTLLNLHPLEQYSTDVKELKDVEDRSARDEHYFSSLPIVAAYFVSFVATFKFILVPLISTL